jgi:hypothetical protein
MWIVHFKSWSGDDYYALFDRKPTEGELKTYIVKHFGGEIEDGESYVSARLVQELPVETPNDDPESYKDVDFDGW